MVQFKRVQRWILALTVALSALVMPMMSSPTLAATTPTLKVDAGAQSPDMAVQLAYFFNREVTIRPGTTVIFNFATGEPHSIVIPEGTGGGGAPIDSGFEVKGGPAFPVTFPNVGDFPYHCGLHQAMTGVVHVRSTGTVPTQQYYDTQSAIQKGQLFGEGRNLMAQYEDPGRGQVTVGTGVMHATGSIFIMRFLHGVTTVKVGDTVTFTNHDPEAPHTITLNMDFPNPEDSVMPVGLDTPLPVLPGHATAHATTDQINSGFLWRVPVLPPPLNRGPVFKMTFTTPGLYNYHCELHDVLGMTGQIRVVARDN